MDKEKFSLDNGSIRCLIFDIHEPMNRVGCLN